MEKHYAHSLPGKPKEEWQPLEEHLKNVVALAREFAEEFGAGE
jgi:CRISPR-associated endonuclease/helicase Cas3